MTIPGGGEVVFLAIGAADRDPDRFADPDEFQIPDLRDPLRGSRRNPGAETGHIATGHIAFGHGIHYCLGAPLARMEAEIALRILLDRCADLTLAVDPDDIAWQVNPHLRGPAALPVRFTPFTPRRNLPNA